MIGISCTEFCSSPVSEWVGPVSESFRLWEIFSEADHCVCRDTRAIADLLDAHDLACQVHAPICDWNIAALSDRLREASFKETVATIEAAEELGAGVVTVHPGLRSMVAGGMEDRAVDRAKAAMRVLDRFMDGRDVTVAVENMSSFPYFIGRTAAQLAEILDGTGLKVCLDIGHAHTMGQIDAMIDTFGDRIANIHIHDNHGTSDEHLTIGEGTVDFDRVIGRLHGYRGNWIIESKSLESGVQSLSRLSSMLPS